jgi:hypothetical protein
MKLESIFGDGAKRYVPLIDTVKKMKGVNGLFKEVLNFNNTRMPDFIVELVFASYFCEEGYIVEFVPRSEGEITPDLHISKNELRGYVEIKHIHKKHDGPGSVVLKDFKEIPEDEFLEMYGDHVRDERYCRDKILEGFQQIQQYSGLKATDAMIVAIWNSDGDLDDLNMKFTITNLIDERSEFDKMQNNKWIIFGSPWYSLRKNTQFHIFRF